MYTPDNGDEYNVRDVYYADVRYNSIDELVNVYNGGNVTEYTPFSHKKYADR